MGSYIDDVLSEPELLKEILKQYRSKLGDQLKEAAVALSSKPLTVFAGMGSSLYAAVLPKLIFASAGRSAFVEEAGELLHYGGHLSREMTSLVAISQSGESAETAALLQSFVRLAVSPTWR